MTPGGAPGTRTWKTREGIQLFNRREFFECHEVLEEVWVAERGPRRLFLQSLIHLAVGLHHWQGGNPTGAAGQLRKGLLKLREYLPHCEGIDTGRLYRDAELVLGRIEAGDRSIELFEIHACG